jgi:hypothetical protein
VLVQLVLCCPSSLFSSCRTAKWLEITGWLSQYSFSLLCLPLLHCHYLVFCFTYMRLRSSSHYILVGLGMHWLDYIIGIVGTVE